MTETETLAYDVVETVDAIELRAYAPYIVAEVSVDASDYESAANQGFRPLADYIFGNNLPRDEIAMTAPVMAEPAGETNPAGEAIAMTAPVTSSVGGDGTFVVRFSMPSQWSMESLPEPNDPRVRLREVGAQRVLATTFRGRTDRLRIEAGSQALLDHALAMGFGVDDEPTWAGYSAPYVPVPLRRWEMLLRLSS